jgi:hypothetical protein
MYQEVFNLNIYKKSRKVFTRDPLLAEGYLDEKIMYFIINHWSS